jgi:hypothetical protein
VPAITARGAIVEKGRERRKVIGDYLNNQPNCSATPVGAAEGCDLLILIVQDQKIAAFGNSYMNQDFLATALALTLR